jgi:hypothetical protein
MTEVGTALDRAPLATKVAIATLPRAHARGSLLRVASWLVLTAVVAVGGVLRVWELNRYGFNSDEAVYAGQAASIAGHEELSKFFPTFRAHPLLFQSLLSLGFKLGWYDLFGRIVAAVIGLGTVFLAYKLGKLLYGWTAGALAGLFMALMPYHVVVSRQVLLDGPMVLFTTLALYLLARFAITGRTIWLYSAGGAMGLAFLAKETSIVLLGAVYVFFALSPEIRIRIRQLILAFAVMACVIAPFPISMAMAGRSQTGGQYLAWQLFRRPNHDFGFYLQVVPQAMGYLVVLAALLGLFLLRRERSWRERLLLAWITVPVFFFQLWPVKGFQYLLPIAPAVAVLAARTLARWRPEAPTLDGARSQGWKVAAAGCIVATTLLAATWSRIEPSQAGTFLAGSGGVPGGREAGTWIQANVPVGARFMTVGPSMANLVQYYGNRKAFGLSVSPNPLRRNPAYEPVPNPDFQIRQNEIQYLVWDSFSAARSPFFSEKLLRYADRYNGRVVHVETIPVTTASGSTADKPVIVVYQVRPLLASPRGVGDD